MEQAVDILGEYSEAADAIAASESDMATKYRSNAGFLLNTASELKALRDKAAQIQGLEPAVKEAGLAFFELLIGDYISVYEVENFMADYEYTYDAVLARRPKLNEYNYLDDYYNDLYAWYQATTEALDAIKSCPASMKSEWEHYRKVIDLNASIIEKEYLANELTDWLRYYAAGNMTNRYTMAEYNVYQAMISCYLDEVEFADIQYSLADAVSAEILAYADMDADERADYKFTDYAGKIMLDYDTVDVIYPSLFNSYDAFIILKTGSYLGNHSIVVEAEIPGFTQKYKQSFDLGPFYQTVYIKPAALTGDLNLSSAKDAQINISIYESDGTTLIDSKTFPVTIKSINDMEWSSDEFGLATQDNILCFLTPESSAIAELKRTAIKELSEMTGGAMESFPGYQYLASDGYLSNPYAITYLQAAGIMRALNVTGVRYNMDTFSLSGSDQHILLPEEVLS